MCGTEGDRGCQSADRRQAGRPLSQGTGEGVQLWGGVACPCDLARCWVGTVGATPGAGLPLARGERRRVQVPQRSLWPGPLPAPPPTPSHTPSPHTALSRGSQCS